MTPAAKDQSEPRHRFGAHLSIAGGMHNAIAEALRLKCEVVQVFVKNQRQWRSTPFDPADLEQWHALRATPGFGPVVAHATYLVNLASPDRQLYTRSCAAFTEELQRCQTLSIPYLIFHPGSGGESDREQALARVATALNQIFDRHPQLTVMPLLETTAAQGATLGRSPAELGAIVRGLQEPQRVGVCVDTCHVFAAGYDLRAAERYAALMAELAQEVGLDRIRCWHLNDSLADCGARRDRHEHVGRGKIGLAGFRNLLADARFFGVPMILETPKGTDAAGHDFDAVNLRRLRSWSARYNPRPTSPAGVRRASPGTKSDG